MMELPQHRVVAGGYQRPHVERRPHRRPASPHLPLARSVPESRLNGATPTRTQSRLGAMVPSSGNPASSVPAKTGPAPGTLRSSRPLARQVPLACTVPSSSRPVRSSPFPNHRTWEPMRLSPEAVAKRGRFYSATIISRLSGLSSIVSVDLGAVAANAPSERIGSGYNPTPHHPRPQRHGRGRPTTPVDLVGEPGLAALSVRPPVIVQPPPMPRQTR